jgi:hypothetical protein
VWPFFSSGGGVGATVEAARGRLGCDGGLGRPGGRGPVGRGGKIGRLEKKEEWAATGPKAEENYFRIKFGFFEYTKALEICPRRFRRNFDMRIFPTFS